MAPDANESDEGRAMNADRALRLERLYEAVALWVHEANAKVLHVLTCADCKQLEEKSYRWCEVANRMGRRQLDAATAIRNAHDAVADVQVTP